MYKVKSNVFPTYIQYIMQLISPCPRGVLYGLVVQLIFHTLLRKQVTKHFQLLAMNLELNPIFSIKPILFYSSVHICKSTLLNQCQIYLCRGLVREYEPSTDKSQLGMGSGRFDNFGNSLAECLPDSVWHCNYPSVCSSLLVCIF